MMRQKIAIGMYSNTSPGYIQGGGRLIVIMKHYKIDWSGLNYKYIPFAVLLAVLKLFDNSHLNLSLNAEKLG